MITIENTDLFSKKDFKLFNLKTIKNYKINTKLNDDWKLINSSNKFIFSSFKENYEIKFNDRDVIKFITKYNDYTLTNNKYSFKQKFGVINNEILDENEYNKILQEIEDQNNILDVKDKDFIIGNVYETQNNSKFIYLGVFYVIEKTNKLNNNKVYISISKPKKKHLILRLDDYYSFFDFMKSNDKKIKKDLGNFDFVNPNDIIKIYYAQSFNDPKVYKISNDKNVSSILELKKENLNFNQMIESNRKHFYIKDNNDYYKFLGKKTYSFDEYVSGRSIQPSKIEYNLFEKVLIKDNEYIETGYFKYEIVKSTAWYHFSNNIEVTKYYKNKYLYFKAIQTSLNKNEIYTLDI